MANLTLPLAAPQVGAPLSRADLARRGVRVICSEPLQLRCVSCGHTWAPAPGPGYWRCPACYPAAHPYLPQGGPGGA